MNLRLVPIALCLLVGVSVLTACSSAPREPRKPSVAVVISVPRGERPSPTEITALHQLLQPEIERRGYVMAKSSRSADYFVEVRYPFDPLSVTGVNFVRAEPTVPFLKDSEWQPDVSGNREYKRAIAEMIREPK